MAEITLDRLTSSNLLIRNTIWNFLAQGLPIFIAFFTIPMIIKGFGTDRFSILTLVWSIIGYSSLFDLGMGRALTQFISKKLGSGENEEISKVIWTSLLIITLLGVLAATLICLITPVLTHLIKVPKIYLRETTYSFYLLGISLPFMIITISLKGVLEACQKFAMISILRIPIIAVNYVGPLLILPFTKSLFYTVMMLVIGRIITTFIHFYACAITVNNFYEGFGFNKTYLKPLISFGGWITVSNIISPIMNYMDRFIIAGMLSATVVAYYSTPYDVISKLSIIPVAIMGVIFPALSAEFVKDKMRTKRLYQQSLKYIILLMLPIIIFGIFAAKWGLTLWLSADFAQKSYKLTQLLLVSIFLQNVSISPCSLIQASGRSDITAKVYLIELPIYLFSLWFFIRGFGLMGAVIASLVRSTLDFILMSFLAVKFLENHNYEKI